MSMSTWIEEFYPVDAYTFLEKERTKQELVEHSLKKWQGALPRNLKKHKVKYEDYDVFDTKDHYTNKVIHFDGESCVLCCFYREKAPHNCSKCPIVEVTGFTCDNGDYEGMIPGSRVWDTSGDNPEPMIKLLKETLAGLPNVNS